MAQSSGKSTVKSDSCGECDDLTVLIITALQSVIASGVDACGG